MKQVVDKMGIRSLLLLMLIFVFCGKAMAEDFSEDGLYYSTLTNNTVKVVKPTSGMYSGNITIPETVTYNGTKYKVTAIGNNAFQGSSVTSVTLPLWGITSIGSYAFNDCTGLTEFTLPASITSIGDHAFYYCDKLKHLYVHSTSPASYNPGSMAFSSINRAGNVCTLHVPTGCTADYAADPTFSVFTQVVEYDPPQVYDLFVAGTQVTSINASDILGDGVASYNASTNTLTISGDITATGSASCIQSNMIDLTVHIADAATLTAHDRTIYIEGHNTTITGSSQLTLITTANNNAVYQEAADLTFSEANVNIVGNLWCTGNNLSIVNSAISVKNTLYSHNDGNSLSITNSDVTVEGWSPIRGWKSLTLKDCYIKVPLGGSYDTTKKELHTDDGTVAERVEIRSGAGPTLYSLYVAGTHVTSENASDILGDGVASYNASTNTLTISGDITATGSASCIQSNMIDLTVHIADAATLTAHDRTIYIEGHNTTITGSSQLTLITTANNNAVYQEAADLTFSEANVNIVGNLWCTGNNLSIVNSAISVKNTLYSHNDGNSLSITNSDVTVEGWSPIRGWKSVTLTDCYIETPEGGVYDTADKRLEDKNGNPAQEVIIKKNKPAYILGDANGDGVVNVTDIVATVNYIMVKPSADFNPLAADVNNDGEVNVTDIVGMVNIIMKGGIQDAREVMSVLRRSGFIF